MKIKVERKLLEEVLTTLRDTSLFMGQGFHNNANEVLKNVLRDKNRIENILIINPKKK